MASRKEPWEMTLAEFVSTFPFERGAKESLEQGLTSSPGEAGEGIYAYVLNPMMREHYTRDGEEVIKIKMKDGKEVIDLTKELDDLVAYARAHIDSLAERMGPSYVKPKIFKNNIQRFGSIIEQYVGSKYPHASAYIVPHQGSGIPSGKQVVIRNQDDIIAVRTKDIESLHKQQVQNALAQFMPVPENVLAEYPELSEEKNNESKTARSQELLIMRIATIIKDEDIPKPDILAMYVEALKIYLKDFPNQTTDIARLINNLPAASKIRKDFSFEECKLLYETIGYLWKKLTGKDIISEAQIQKSPASLMGNYWLLKNGVILHGHNHYTVAKQNMHLICSLLHIHAFAMHQYLASHPDNIIHLLIKNGAIRVFVNKSRKAYFQMTDKTYGEWGKKRVKRFDFKDKIVKVIDKTKPYEGWKSGITILL
jgi:hypothetical protein